MGNAIRMNTRNSWLRHSFLGKITEINISNNLAVLDNSRILRWLIVSSRKFRKRIKGVPDKGSAIGLFKGLKKSFFSSPINIISLTGIAAVLTNIGFSLIFRKEISLFGWAIRISFFLLGLSGLFCQADWKDIRDTSITLKLIKCGLSSDAT
jgi:hypothetical protein